MSAEPSPPAEGPLPPAPVVAETLIARVLAERPGAARVLFEEFRLPCSECELRDRETVAEGVRYLGHDLARVLERLNACAPRARRPVR